MKLSMYSVLFCQYALSPPPLIYSVLSNIEDACRSAASVEVDVQDIEGTTCFAIPNMTNPPPHIELVSQLGAVVAAKPGAAALHRPIYLVTITTSRVRHDSIS